MRHPTRWVWSAAVLGGMAASGSFSVAQQAPQQPPAMAAPRTPQLDPVISGRSARNLLRNGVDYLDTYRDPRRALIYLQAAATRGTELSASETKTLADAMARAQAMIQAGAPAQPARAVQTARTSPRSTPLLPPTAAPTPTPAAPAADPIQLTGGDAMATPPAVSQPGVAPSALPPGTPAVVTAPPAEVPPPQPGAAARPDAPLDLPLLPASTPSTPPPQAETPLNPASPTPRPADAPAPSPAPAPAPGGSSPRSQPANPTEPAENPLDLIPAPTAEDLEAIPPVPASPPSEAPPTQPQIRSQIQTPPQPEAPAPVPVPVPTTPPQTRQGAGQPAQQPEMPVNEPELPPLPGAEPSRPAQKDENLLPPLPGDPQNQSSATPPAAPQPLEPPAQLPETQGGQAPLMPSNRSASPSAPAIAAPLSSAARELDGPVTSSSRRATEADSLPPLPPAADELPPLPPPGPVGAPAPREMDEPLEEDLPPLPPDARFSPPLMPGDVPTEALPRPDAPSLPGASESAISSVSPAGDSILSEETMREVLEVARRQEETYRKMARQNPYENSPFGPITPEGTQTQTEQLTRAPSPTEARPIRPIRVPDDFVPLQARQWEAKRKYWSAPGTCYMPLYFQDAVLERYGQSAEQALGPRWGRFFSYPLDDPRESTQRNQILQPFYSIGKFASQIVVLPYNLVMDPPWEAQYDLGYYRPGDRIPPDTIYLPKTGIGPPLQSRSY